MTQDPTVEAHLGADSRLRQDFDAAEREGLMQASLVRIAAICVVILWQALDNPDEGLDLLFDLAQIGSFALLGVLQYLCARQRFQMDVLKYVFVALDCALLAVVLLMPDPFETDPIPPAVRMDTSSFLYFYILLLQAAFSFRPALMLWCGAWIMAARTGMLFWMLGQPGVHTNLDLADDSTQAALAARSDPNFLCLGFWALEMLVTLIVAGGLALLVRRSRRLVARRVHSERARASLARYFSPNVVDRLSASADPLGTAREQNVAILFTDIMGFTTLCETAPPHEVVELLRGYHDRLGQAVFNHGGTLDKYIGDGLMATFGTPEPADDDAERALACTLDMVAALEAWNEERHAAGLKPVRVGIGLHYGAVIAGDIGNARRLEYGVIGDSVNVASRLEHLCREHDAALVVSGDLIAAIRGNGKGDQTLVNRLRNAGRHPVRGRAGATELWVLPGV